ncbi:hypothetical protein [Caudoviricetes sp.]|nr:hypothetical protein [Caudoviricetes sp.]
MTPFVLVLLSQVAVYNNGIRVHPSAKRLDLNGSITCTRAGVQVNCTASGGAPVDGGYVVISTAGSTNERTLSAGQYTVIDTATPGQIQVDWQHGLTCGANDVLTTGSTATMTCVSNVATASALQSDPSDCGANQYAAAIAANGNLSCSTVEINGTNGTLNAAHGGLGTTQPTCSGGQFITCNGSTCSCGTPSGGGSRTTYASNGSDTPIAVATTDPGVSLISKTLTVAANDTITMRVWVDIMNNSGATKTYTLRCRIGSTTLVAVSDSTTLAAGTTRGVYELQCIYGIRSTSSTRVAGRLARTPTTAANTTQTGADRAAWNTSASNWTGSQTFALNVSSSATGATQDAIVTAYEIVQQASSP